MYSATDVGRVRKINQDSHTHDEILGFGVVADGIGGKPGGDVASQIVVKTIRESIRKAHSITYSQIAHFMLRQVQKSHHAVLNYGQEHRQYEGMGTTMEFLFFVGETINIAHVGDSRTYVYYRDHLFQITIDHNIKTFVERGLIQAKNRVIQKNGSRLTKGIGILDNPDPDFYQKRLTRGELYLTATDGLFDMVEDGQIKHIISSNLSNIEGIPDQLINQANKNGGRDNTTVLICGVSS